jgi:hypothetical protein
MTKQTLLSKTIEQLQQLPERQLKEVADFTEFLLSKKENYLLNKGIQMLIAESKAFEFLREEEELYSVEDLKEKYV